MKETIVKIISNGFLYGVYTIFLCFCIGYFIMPLKTLLIFSIPIALCSMILNGAIYTRFTKPVKVLEKIQINTEDSENVMIEAPANHLIDNDIVSGKLCLTDKRLLFKSHKQEEFVWDKAELHTMVFYRSFKNKGGEFTLKNKADRRLMFEVDQLKSWKTLLQNN
ncbi:hypothetical protein J2Y38_003682 [Flavobacterium sp. 2755]|uniref:hypothetical protein n=1 Tax=Flavobacterium sp. 2755 TaxID=2817765 RepID=UPI002862A819|nr:hypothetical protein [Flavobacterium sp. 2755]MDR6763461.1 hypothetical protein [Flavobacterium sp. 2755]